jgi:hypothetical protein
MKTYNSFAILILGVIGYGCGGAATNDVGILAESAVSDAQGALGSQVSTALAGLKGKTLTDTTGALGGGDWTIGDFGVVADIAGGEDPVVAVAKGQVKKYIPIGTEGDAADLVTRVTGSSSSLLKSGTLSDGYRQALGLGN